MRIRFALAAAGLAVATAAPAAFAVERTFHVPIFHCDVTVRTNDAALSVNHRGVHFDRSGDNNLSSNC